MKKKILIGLAVIGASVAVLGGCSGTSSTTNNESTSATENVTTTTLSENTTETTSTNEQEIKGGVYTLSTYLANNDNLIIYEGYPAKKENYVECIYVLNNGTIKQKVTSGDMYTFADVAKMTDDEVISAFDKECTYDVGTNPESYKSSENAGGGLRPFYNSKYMIVGKTDNSGKIVEEEYLYFLKPITSGKWGAVETIIDSIPEGYSEYSGRIKLEDTNDKKEIYSSEYTVLEHGSDAPYGGSICNKYESDSRCIRTNGETFVIDPVDYIDVDFKDEEITEKLEALNK